MSNRFFDKMPPDKNPLINESISRVEVEADLARAFTTGFRLCETGATVDDLQKVENAFCSICPTTAEWLKAGYVYAYKGFSRTEATLDFFEYKETGRSKLKDMTSEGKNDH